MPSRRRFQLLGLALIASLLSGCFDVDGNAWALHKTTIAQVHAHGLTGEGVRIAVLDTGFDGRHVNLAHLVDRDVDNGEVVAFRDFLSGHEGIDLATDDDGHGSHILSILAARPAKVGWLRESELMGVAPGASFVVAKVCRSSGCDGTVIDDALTWAIDQQVDIITMSLGGQIGEDTFGPLLDLDPMEAAINRAINRGILVVASAGNDGEKAGDVAFPARMEGVIAVGAVNSDLQVAPFSSRGDASENQCTAGLIVGFAWRCFPHQKPEIVAPGVEITGAWRNGNMADAAGTSQAAPYVAGALALLLEDRPALQSRTDVYEIKEALALSARPIDGSSKGHDNASGYGLLDAYAAWQRVR